MSENKWEPDWYAEIDEDAEDSDYLRKQDCCAVCGAHIGYLPGYYYIESDVCPNCVADREGETWSEELIRLTDKYGLDKEEIDKIINKCKEMGI